MIAASAPRVSGTRVLYGAARLARRAEFGDALLLLYAAAFVRQYFWAVGDNRAAWVMTAACSASLWIAHLWLKDEPRERTPPAFWAVVVPPLVAVYLLRFALPDLSYDVLNYRLVQAERSLRGLLFMPGDFFPAVLPLNPAPDTVAGLSRLLLGYRLGTVVNLLALVWAGTIIDRLLRPYIRGDWRRAAGVLLVLFTEHMLFEVSTYMVDLLSLPLLLEATRVALDYRDSAHKGRDLIYGGLLIGAALAMKLTNAAPALPVVLVFVYQVASARRPSGRLAAATALAALACLLPLLPHALYILRETGSPFFPLYNEIFKSPYWPLVNIADGRWGPQGLWQTLVWPLLIPFRTARLCEPDLAVYAGRLSLGFLAALVCLVLPGLDQRARLLAFITLAGSVLWAATSGYARYMFPLEVLGGVLVLRLALHLRRAAGALAAALLCSALAAQSVAAGVFVYQREWGGRPNFFQWREAHLAEAREVLRDRDPRRHLAPAEREMFDGVGAWVVSCVKSNGVEALLRADVPMLGINYAEYFQTVAGRERFTRALSGAGGRRLYTLCLTDELGAARENMAARGLRVGEVSRLSLPFFSARRRLPMALVEVLPPGEGGAAAAEGPAPLPDAAFRAALSLPEPPVELAAGSSATVRVIVRNAGEYAWPATGLPGGKFAVTVADSWLDARTGALVNNLDGRGSLPHNLAPGEAAEVSLKITAPKTPGAYLLELDVVQEQVAFFKERGSEPLRVKVMVR